MRTRTGLAVSSLLLTILLSADALQSAPAAEMQTASTLAGCLDDGAIALVHIDLARVDLPAVAKQFVNFVGQGIYGLELPELDSFVAGAQAIRAQGGRHLYVVLAPTPFNNRNPYFVVLPEAGKDPQPLIEVMKRRLGSAVTIGEAIVGGNSAVTRALQLGTTTPRPHLEAALAAIGDPALSLYVVPSTDQQRALEETLPNLPATLGGGPITVVTRGVRWAVVGCDTSTETLSVIVQSKDAAAAEALRDFLRDLPGKINGAPWLKPLFPEGHLPDALVPTVQNDRLTLSIKRSDPAVTTFENAFADAGKALQLSLSRPTRMRQIKQIILAMHNEHDVLKHFPPAAIYGKDGKPLLSWRVLILPFVEEGKLYREFHLDEPWDSEHNKKLIARMPRAYRSLEAKPGDIGRTTILAVTGENSVFRDTVGTQIRDITDGTVNTIMIVDAPPNQAVIWTKPDDFDADAPEPLKRLLGGREGFVVGVCDGSAQFVRTSMKPETFRALLTINDGQVIEYPW